MCTTNAVVKGIYFYPGVSFVVLQLHIRPTYGLLIKVHWTIIIMKYITTSDNLDHMSRISKLVSATGDRVQISGNFSSCNVKGKSFLASYLTAATRRQDRSRLQSSRSLRLIRL